jgi:RHS repeat-associated protein
MTQSAVCASDVYFAPSRSTGKERDSESGNDYFGARYYASTMGRFLSPDWSAKVEPVPYAKLENPQSLNLYGYVLNNPLGKADADGHDVVLGNDTDANRKATASTVTASLNANEKKMFTVGVDKKTGRNELLRLAGPIQGKHTEAFTRLAAEVGDHSHTVTVQTQSTYTDGSGPPQSIASHWGGGVTEYQANGNSLVMLAPEGNLNPNHPPGTTYGLNGGFVPDPPSIIAGHEVMGHAFEHMTTGHSEEPSVRHFENQMRQEQTPPLPPRSEQ